MKKENGITLVSLILTVVVLILIVGVSINIGINSLDSTRLKGFYTQLELVQKRVDDIAATNESYIDESGNIIYLKEKGVVFGTLDSDKQAILTNIINIEGGNVLSGYIANFRYFTSEELESILGIPNIDYNVFIDFENRIVIAEQGIQIKDKQYHMLKSDVYFVETDTSKNIGTIESLQYNIHKYGSDKYKITVTPSNIIGDLDGIGYLKYKKTTTKYWETSNSLEIIVELDIEYNIIYMDSNKNSIEKIIKVEFEKDEEGNFIQDNDENKILTVTEITEEQESEEI